MSKDAAGFTAHQLRHIRILFLRHQAAARGAAIGEPNKSELLTGPKNHLFTEATEVHHHQRSRRTELNGEVAVTDGIQAVGVEAFKASKSSAVCWRLIGRGVPAKAAAPKGQQLTRRRTSCRR